MNKLIAAFSAFGLLACSAVPVGVTPAPIGNSAVKYSKSVQLAKPDHMTADLIRSHIRQNGAYSDRKDFIEYWIRYDHSSSSEDLYTIGFDLIRTESMFFAGSRYSVLINGYDGDRLTVDPSVTLSSNIGQNNIYYYLDISSDIPIDSKIGTMVMTEYRISLDSGGEPANPNLDIFGLLSFQFNSLFYYDDETDPMIQIEELSTGEDLPTPDGTATGYSSVYSDLLSFEVPNLDFYRAGLSPDPKLIHLSEDEDGYVYIYVYRNDNNLTFDRIDISVNIDIGSSNFKEDYKTYDLKIISNEDYLIKYQVLNLKSDMRSKRRYAVRQIFNSETQHAIGEITTVALEYLIAQDDFGKWQSQVNSIDSVKVDGISAFELIYNGYPSVGLDEVGYLSVRQRYYRAFNTDIMIDDIMRIDIKYQYQIFTGLTNIGVHLNDWNDDHLLKSLKSSDQFVEIDEPAVVKTETVSVYPDTINYESTKPWFFKKYSASYKTIQETSKLTNINEGLKDYKWIVTFRDEELRAFQKILNLFTYRYYIENFTQVHSSSIMTMKVKTNGEIKELTVIDAYHQSSGNIPVEPEKDLTLWQKIIRAWQNVLSGKADIGDWVVFVVSLIVGVLVLGIVGKVLQLILSVFRILFGRTK